MWDITLYLLDLTITGKRAGAGSAFGGWQLLPHFTYPSITLKLWEMIQTKRKGKRSFNYPATARRLINPEFAERRHTG